jgi:hypothetical protein
LREFLIQLDADILASWLERDERIEELRTENEALRKVAAAASKVKCTDYDDCAGRGFLAIEYALEKWREMEKSE